MTGKPDRTGLVDLYAQRDALAAEIAGREVEGAQDWDDYLATIETAVRAWVAEGGRACLDSVRKNVLTLTIDSRIDVELAATDGTRATYVAVSDRTTGMRFASDPLGPGPTVAGLLGLVAGQLGAGEVRA